MSRFGDLIGKGGASASEPPAAPKAAPVAPKKAVAPKPAPVKVVAPEPVKEVEETEEG